MATDGYRSVAYYCNWAIYARKHRPQDVAVENLTHILYAFGNIRPESGEVYLTDAWADTDIKWEGDSAAEAGTNMYGCLKQLNLLKKRNRNLKVLLSIGGWTYSSNFKAPMATPAGRALFASSAVSLLKNYGFDGIDIDWEYPVDSQEAANFVSLLQECRSALDACAATVPGNPHFELTVASPAGPAKYGVLDLAGMDRWLDFWNLMAYDYAGSWDTKAGHLANLRPSQSNPDCTPYSTTRALDDYVSRGVPAGKIVLGMPLYGRAFENTDGLGKPYNGIGPGNWEQGVYDFKSLPLPGATEQRDDEAGATYCYNPASRTLVSYDTVDMGKQKADFIKQRGLGGGMWWETSGDRTGAESLIGNVVQVLGGPQSLQKRDNCLLYPETKYDNLRTGFPNN